MNASDRIKLHKMQRNKHSALQCEDISMLHKFDLLSIILMVRLTSAGEKSEGHTMLVVCRSALCKIRNGKFNKLLKPQERVLTLPESSISWKTSIYRQDVVMGSLR